MELANQNETYALVTGGTSGIGLAFVHQLAEKGYNVCVVSNQQEALGILEKEIVEKYNVKCVSLFINLAEDDAAQNVYRFCKENHLTVEVLINNAGILIADEFVNVPAQKITTLLKLHTLTPTFLCQLFAKDMIALKNGYILTVSSTSAHMPYPLISLYGPTKSYIRNFTKAIRSELYDQNIHVTCVLPGAVDTSLYNLDNSQKNIAKKLKIMHSPEFIAKKGLRALFNNKGEVVPGILNKLSLVFLKFVPDVVVRKLLHWWNHSKHNPKNKVLQSTDLGS